MKVLTAEKLKKKKNSVCMDRTESLETDPHTYGQLISNKGSKIHNGERLSLQQSSVRKAHESESQGNRNKSKNKQMGLIKPISFSTAK